MLIDNEDELKKKKEEARQLRNSFGMVTDNDKKIYGNDNFSFSDSTSSISNKHDSEDFSTTQNNSYSQRLEEAKKIRNSFGMTTTKDSGNDDFMNFSKDDDTITTIHQKDDNNISGTPKYYDTNIDNIEKTANTDTSINENTETEGESKTKKTDNNPSITRKVDQPSYKNISLSVANPEQTKNAKPIVDYTLQQQKEEKDSQNIFVKAGTWIKDLFGSIGVSIKNTATGLYKTAKEGYDERKEAVDNMSESDIQNSSNKNKILADTIAPNTFLTNTNNNENLNSQKTKLIINDTIQDVSRSTANGLIGIANNVLNFLTFGTLSKDTIKKIPDFSVLQNSEQYGEYSSQEELTNSIQNDKKQDLADYGLYNPSANAVADITVDVAEFLLLKKAGLGSTSAMVTSGTANTLGETGNVEDATKSAVSNYVFSKVLDNKLINEKLGNAVFNGTKGKVVEALGKHGELLDTDTQMKIVKGLSSASATFSETFVSRILTNELQAVGDYGNDVYNKDVQKNILVDGVIWSAIYAGISGFSGAYAKVDVEQSNINDAEAKRQLENCYSIMELDPSKEYTIEELNKQRKELVKKYHPDLAGGSNEKMATINNAYDVLNKYITEGVIDKVVIHTESSNTPPKEDNIKEKQNGMVVTKDGQIYVDSNDILKQTATNIAKSQITPAITTIVDKDNNLTGLEQVNVVPFEVENSKVPTITPAIYVSDDGSINVIDTNTGTKLLTNAKDADTAIETVTKALQSNDESNIRNIENEITKNSIQVEQAIGNIIDKINEKTGENNAPDISQENQDDYFSSTFGNMPNINEDSPENSFYGSPTSYIPQEQSVNIEANNAIKNLSTESTENYIKPENHTNMEDRTYENVGNKKVLPYQTENPEISQDIKDMAANFMEDLACSIPGERYKAGDTWTGQKRSTTKELANFKDLTGASWDKISKVLNDIYDGNGNYALAKKMELELDQALSEGYTNIHGKVIMPNNEYLKKKSKIEGKNYLSIEENNDYVLDDDARIFGMKKKNSNNLAKKSNIKYNSNGIQLGKREYANVMSLINTNNTNNSKGTDSIFSSNYFYIYENDGFNNNKIIAKIEIEKNEDLINALRKEIKNGTNAGTKNISNTIQTARNVRKFNNSNNDSNKRTQTNKQAIGLYNNEGRQRGEIGQRRDSQKSIRNKSGIENSKQSSFNLHKNNTSNQIKAITNSAPTSNDDIRYMKKSGTLTQSKELRETDNKGRELSKQQQDYFKNSKVRDNNGNLKVVYHGTDADFTVFNYDYLGKNGTANGKGFYLADDINVAKSYSNGKNLIEAYVDIQKPLSIGKTTMSENDYIKFVKAVNDKTNGTLFADYGDGEKLTKNSKEYNDVVNQFKEEYKYGGDDVDLALSILNSANIKLEDGYRLLRNTTGYDGIIVPTNYKDNGKDIPYTQYIPLTPEQIKNVDNTSPTNNVDIRYLKNSTSQDSVSKINVNNIPKTVDTELGKTNAEREDSYIEKEIQKVEAKGNWDNSIPVTKLSDINKTIEDYLQLKIKKGRFRQDAYGIYKDKRDVLRVQEYKDIDTALHEAGHAMDLGKRINIDKESISEELLNAIDKYGGYEGEPRSIKLDEGFAEVIREYGIKPEEAKKDYPNTIAILENMRMQDKSFDDFISKVQEMTYNYIHQSPRNRTLSNLSVGEQTDKKIWNKKTIKTEIMRNVFDSDYALKVAVSDLAKASGKKVSDIKATENAYILTRLASGIGERVTSILADGLIDENGEKRFEGLNKIGDILGKNPERYNDLRAYLVAQRDTEYKARTLRTGIRSMDSQSVINQFKNDSQIKEASKIIYNALDGVLQYAVDNHLLTSENAEALRESNAFYVPMQRVLENDRGNNVGNRGRVNDIIKKRTGSELDVKDVLENIISNSSNIIRQVENNNVLKALYKQGEESGLTGAVYDVIPAPMFKVGTQTLATWEKELKRQGVNTENLDLQKSIDIFSPSNKVDSKNLITSFIDDNGKRKYLQFYDEDVFNNLMGMDRKFMSKILSISNKLNMPLRSGATIRNIGFAIPNMISDTAQAAVYSTAGFIPIVDNAIGVLNILAVENKHVEKFLNQIAPEYEKKVNFIYELYKQSGAPSSTRLSQYRKSTQSIMNEIYGTKSSTLGIKESFKPLKRILDILAYIPDISEQSTRFRVYQKNYNYYKSKGNSEMDSRIMAAIESRDATQDFGRTGNITREINQLIPFSAARVGSSYTFAEKVSDNPKKVGFRIAMLTATALAISAMGYNSTKIQELNQRKKDDNFVFDIGDNVITIKKPQGVLRSIINLAEYIQDLATGHIEEGKEGERLGTWLNNAIMDNMPADEVTGLVPNAVAPLIENAINKDFYYNTDIVKSYDLDLPESEQYYDYNSQLSKWIGSIFNYSPAKIDNLISGYFGGLGTSVTNTIDYVLGKMEVIPEQAEMGAERNSVGKRFFVNVNSNSKSLDELYNTKDELTKKKNGGTITPEETKQLEKINEASSQIADINKKIKSIKSDEYLDGQEKAEKIKALQSERTDTARQALGKELMDTSNKTRIESTKFYPSNSTLKQNKYTLTLTDEMKNEYERVAYERYSQYSGQGLYNEDYLQKLETKCKDYAKNYMMQKYKSQLVKSK